MNEQSQYNKLLYILNKSNVTLGMTFVRSEKRKKCDDFKHTKFTQDMLSGGCAFHCKDTGYN